MSLVECLSRRLILKILLILINYISLNQNEFIDQVSLLAKSESI